MTSVPEIARRYIDGVWQTGVAEDGGGGSQPFDITLATGEACVIKDGVGNDLTRIEIDADTYGRIALGLSAEVTGNDSIALGGGAVAGQTAAALGDSASAQGDYSTAVGSSATVRADASGGTAIGLGAYAGAPNGTAIGREASVSIGADDATAIGKGTVAAEAGITVVEGPSGTKVILHSPDTSRFYIAVANDGTLSAVSIP